MKPLDVILIIMVAISAGVAIYFIARGLKRGGGCGSCGGGCGSCGGCNGCKSRGYCNSVNRGEKNRSERLGEQNDARLRNDKSEKDGGQG